MEGGHIFNLVDYHFYQGVYFFFLKQYQEALNEFNLVLELRSNLDSVEESIESDEETHEEEYYDNRIFTKEELKYNIGVTHLMLGNREEAKKILAKYKQFKQALLFK